MYRSTVLVLIFLLSRAVLRLCLHHASFVFASGQSHLCQSRTSCPQSYLMVRRSIGTRTARKFQGKWTKSRSPYTSERYLLPITTQFVPWFLRYPRGFSHTWFRPFLSAIVHKESSATATAYSSQFHASYHIPQWNGGGTFAWWCCLSH